MRTGNADESVDAREEVAAHPAPEAVRRPGRAALLVLPVLILAAVGWFLVEVIGGPDTSGTSRQVIASARDAPRQATLPDGSILALRPDSAMVLRFTPKQRRVDLTHGAGRLTVAPDRRRRFVVATTRGTIATAGATFDVAVEGHNVSVRSLKGSLEVVPKRKAGSPPLIVQPGQTLSFSVHGADASAGP